MTEASPVGNAGWRPQKPAFVQTRERRRFSAALLMSGLGHAAIILLLLALWQSIPDEPAPLTVVPIKIVHEPVGRSGASGGGTGTTAASAPDAGGTTAQPRAAQAPTPQPAQKAAQAQPEPQHLAPQPDADAPAATEALRLTPSPTAPRSIPVEEEKKPVPRRKPVPHHPKRRRAETETREALAQPRPVPLVPPPVALPPIPQAARMPMTSSVAAASQGADLPLPPGIGGRGRGDEGAGKAEVGNGSADGTADDYLEKVWRWILRFRQPPNDDCTRDHGSGSIEVTFLRNGTVTDARIAQSSGCPSSDAEALRMVHAASPLPPIPPQFSGAERTIKMPFDFRPGLLDRLFHGL